MTDRAVCEAMGGHRAIQLRSQFDGHELIPALHSSIHEFRNITFAFKASLNPSVKPRHGWLSNTYSNTSHRALHFLCRYLIVSVTELVSVRMNTFLENFDASPLSFMKEENQPSDTLMIFLLYPVLNFPYQVLCQTD